MLRPRTSLLLHQSHPHLLPNTVRLFPTKTLPPFPLPITHRYDPTIRPQPKRPRPPPRPHQRPRHHHIRRRKRNQHPELLVITAAKDLADPRSGLRRQGRQAGDGPVERGDLGGGEEGGEGGVQG
ncbi:hypothetical protein AOQ84DRAFT_227917, partial [Glonium stellatum]